MYTTGPGAGERRPISDLKGLQRVSLAAGESRMVEWAVKGEMFARIADDGKPVFDAGEHSVIVGGASPGARAVALGAAQPVRATIAIQ